jgi:hypothetical protein
MRRAKKSYPLIVWISVFKNGIDFSRSRRGTGPALCIAQLLSMRRSGEVLAQAKELRAKALDAGKDQSAAALSGI